NDPLGCSKLASASCSGGLRGGAELAKALGSKCKSDQGVMAASREELLARLEELGIKTVTVEHPALFTVEQSKLLRGNIPGAHTKNLFLKCKKGTLWLVVALESTAIDLKTLHGQLGCGRLSFGSAQLLGEVLGVAPGSVTPFSVINDRERRVAVVLDAALMAY